MVEADSKRSNLMLPPPWYICGVSKPHTAAEYERENRQKKVEIEEGNLVTKKSHM